ncbi:MAG TPA: SpoIIE family protein phosphatase [Streptosporangiaceae bacterium]|nr:SpoIIE family protein phosphatase [Streptosporangiaceae bacterium]
MPDAAGSISARKELADLVTRRDALRQAATLGGAGLRATLDAALAELDAAIDALAAAHVGNGAGPPDEAALDALHAERRLLRALFHDAPVALILVERDGAVRRVNKAAGELLGTGSGYATGRPFTAFVNLPSRAAVDSLLTAVIRTGKPRQVRCELLTEGGTTECELTAGLARPRGDTDQLVVAVREAGPPPLPGGQAGTGARKKGGRPAAGKDVPAPVQTKATRGEAAMDAPSPLITAMTRRLDLMTAVARLLLENAPLNETVALQRCARLLARELAAWVIVDVARGQRLRRQYVEGGEDQPSAELARTVAGQDPRPGSLPHTVHETGSSQLITRAEDAGILGENPDGVPLLMQLGATSVLSVPLSDGEHNYGALTMARHPSAGHFELADLGLVEEIGEQLALAITMDRKVRRQTQVADALRYSLLPRELPGVPGVEVATTHLAATENPEVGGDFFDVYRTSEGWGVAIGDVCGRGEGVAAASAAARHAIRVVAHSTHDPADVLAVANRIILAEEFSGRFITACTAHLRWRDGSLEVMLGSAGHPAPLLLRPDGELRQLRGGGLPLGIFPDAGPGLERHELSAGDTLVFYSDGLADAHRPGQGYFDDQLQGEVGALAGRTPGQILARLQQVALEFCQGKVHDDITMLALRVGEPPGRPGQS